MTFSVSTRAFYDTAASRMATLTSQTDSLLTQLSTGKRIQSASDDSLAWARLQTLAQAKTDATTDAANVKLAQGILQQGDSTLGAITLQLQQAQELVVQAKNGTLSAEGKKAIATQLTAIMESVVGLANTKDTRSVPLYGGDGTSAAVTQNADGSLTFAGGVAGEIPLGDGQSVKANANAETFLKTDTSDIGAALTAMIAALNEGGSIPDDASDTLNTVSDQTIATQATLGARAARVDIIAAQQTVAATDREDARSGLEDVDMTTAITELQKTMTVLQATQASFSKLSSLSLFDYLR
jgi:flagellar hook-associated protein 3 FlgL